MAEVQNYFIEFHKVIRLGNVDDNEVLREKRDIVLSKLKTRLKEIFEAREETPPTFTYFNKGSYAMNLGVVPIDCDYDLDMGILFDIQIDDYPDPIEVKTWVYEALYGHTDSVVMKQPCVTVQYHLNEEPVYHLDLAVYAPGDNASNNIYLARGKTYSTSVNRIWQLDDPKGLIAKINNCLADADDRCQFRRVIKYLKRWKAIKFPTEGNAAPIGIGVTVAAYYWFTPQKTLVDAFANKYAYNDLKALMMFVRVMLDNFVWIQHDDELVQRLKVVLPVEPFNDLFKKMTNPQMVNFKDKLERLYSVLQDAEEEADPHEACKILSAELGKDFPIPNISETAQKKAPAIISSSASA